MEVEAKEISITEALAELKLIDNKITKKRNWVLQNLTRPGHLPDPLVDKGGMAAVVSSELQSINDLFLRIVKIRGAIMAANLVTSATVLGKTRTIYEWLVWKKEVARRLVDFNESVYSNTKREIDQVAQKPQAAKTEDNKTVILELIPNSNYMEHATIAADVVEMIDKLDGVLSLINATTLIKI